jgi:hypothetical protein
LSKEIIQPRLENCRRFSKWIFVLETKGVGRRDMTDLNRHFDENVYDLNAILHPGSVFDHPRDVLADATLSRAEKRAILASWASDAAAVTSCPSLRAIPGTKSWKPFPVWTTRRERHPAASRQG